MYSVKMQCFGTELNKIQVATASWAQRLKTLILPEHVAADEKHSRLKGEKVYVPTKVGAECILGVGVSEDAAEKGLTEVYGIFGVVKGKRGLR